MKQIALFGVRSPLAIEYEETCRRAGIGIPFAVSVAGAPRLLSTAVTITVDEIKSYHLDTACVACAFSPVRRRALIEMAVKAGFSVAEALVDPSAILASSVRVGLGSYINAGCVIGGLVMVGENVVFNRSSSAGHHTMMSDFVSIGPGVTLAGNVRIGEGSIIGAGSTILPDIRIGSGAVIAAGSVVHRNVPDNVFVVGNPAVKRAFDFKQSSLNFPDAE